MSITQREDKRRDVYRCCSGGGGEGRVKTTAKRRRPLFNIIPEITIAKLPYFVPHISFFSIMLASITYSVTSPVAVVDMFFFVYRYGYYDQEGKLQIVNYTADPVAGFHAEGEGVPKPQY